MESIGQLQGQFPFALAVFDSDCGSEFNRPACGRTRRTTRRMWSRRTTTWCASTRSTGATTPPPNSACSTGYGSWFASTELLHADEKARRLRHRRRRPQEAHYDKPRTQWQRLQASGALEAQQLSAVAARVEGINPADLTRQINAIQMQLPELAKTKTEALATARHVDLEALQPSVSRLAKA